MFLFLHAHHPSANSTDPRIYCTGPENLTAISLSLILACKFFLHKGMFFLYYELKFLLFNFSAKHLHSSDEQLHSLAGSFGYVAPEVLLKEGHGKPVDIWSTGYSIFIYPFL